LNSDINIAGGNCFYSSPIILASVSLKGEKDEISKTKASGPGTVTGTFLYHNDKRNNYWSHLL